MKFILGCLKQLLPLRYSSAYKTPDGASHVLSWRMWMGIIFDVKND